jgi:hypothetical protein
MPIIAAYTDHPTRPYVRVEINWADVPAANYAGVSRVDVETGECTELRPYVCYLGNELLLSCGHGTFWDTEAPFDRPFYYVTTSSEAPCIPAPLSQTSVVYDPFTRTLADQWGVADTLQPYTELAGVDTQYDVNGSRGLITPDALAGNRYALLNTGLTDYTARINLTSQTIPVGGDIGAYGLNARWVNDNNYIRVGLNCTSADAVGIFVTQVVAGVATATSTSIGLSFADVNTVEIQLEGAQIRVRAWRTVLTPPTTWAIDIPIIDAVLLTSTMLGAHARRDAGNTAPTILSFDEFIVNEGCADCTPVSVNTSLSPITLVNDGRFWLKDPVRPCSDQPVPLCASGAPVLPGCAGEDGDITFVEIGAEIYADNSLRLRPMNRRRVQAITRPRSDVTTSLVLETTTFTARDEVLELVAPGTPLLFQGPSEYGVPDRYMAIGPVNIERQVSDHRIQFRKVTMPYDSVDRPAGPSQGVCGTRVADICALYPTWDDLAATGFTWDDLVRGVADPAIANPDRRTWDDVDVEFTDWNDVEAGGRTWTGLLEGD